MVEVVRLAESIRGNQAAKQLDIFDLSMSNWVPLSRAGKVLSGIAKGKQDLDPQEARTLALAIRTHALRIPELFPSTAHSQAGSGTEAAPAIWETWPEFEKLAQQLADASSDLASAAENADAAEFRGHF